MSDDYEYHEHFVSIASKNAAQVKNLKYDLAQVVQHPGRDLTADELFFLREAGSDIACSLRELIELLEKIERPIDRGDAFHSLGEAIEAIFTVGRIAGVSAKARALAKRYGAQGGTTSAPRRQARADRWRAPLIEAYRELRGSHPEDPTNRLVEKALTTIADMRPGVSVDTATKYIHRLERADLIPKRMKKKDSRGSIRIGPLPNL